MTMRHAVAVGVACAALGALLTTPPFVRADSGPEAEIGALQRQLVEAYLRGDGLFFENLADDATIVHSDGVLRTKADDPEIKKMKSGEWRYETIEVRR